MNQISGTSLADEKVVAIEQKHGAGNVVFARVGRDLCCYRGSHDTAANNDV